MRDLAESLIELLTNSLEAHASFIEDKLSMNERTELCIEDNGHGIEQDRLSDITSPFSTSRITRDLGFGLAFFKQAITQAEGHLDIQSIRHRGTLIKASYNHHHIDAMHLGNIGESIALILHRSPDLDLIFTLQKSSSIQTFRSREIKEVLFPLTLNEPEIQKWIEAYINSFFDMKGKAYEKFRRIE